MKKPDRTLHQFLWISVIGLFFFSSCGPRTLPYFYPLTSEDGADTLGYKTVPDFQFTNQQGQPFTRADLEGKIVVADFFFTSCPGICPVLSSNLTQVQDAIEDTKDVIIFSVSVDPEYDTPSVLLDYASKYQAIPGKWQMLTGDREKIYSLIQNDFKLSAISDSLAPGGITHDDRFVLLDKKGHIRGYYWGSQQEGVDKLIEDIKVLRKER